MHFNFAIGLRKLVCREFLISAAVAVQINAGALVIFLVNK